MTHASAPAPGTRLGPYEITAKLGEGGMGEVWRATDSRLKREVAIKVLPAAFTEDKERLARFEREAQLLAQLHHPNIASIFGLEESAGTRALVLELVDGPTLAERLEQGPLPLEDCISVSLQIARALEAAHEKGIVHRDLKPQNVKAAPEAGVKVLDFGLAKAMDASATVSPAQLAASPTLTAGTGLGVILGTAAYMAPEQAKGRAVDRRADLWAFGAILWECLAGRPLFQRGSVAETLAAVMRDDPDWSALPAGTPRALRELLRRCLVRDPRRRLQSIGDARVALEELLEDPAALEPGESAAPILAAPGAGRRASALALAATAGALLGAAVAAFLVGAFERASPTPEPRIVSLSSAGASGWPVFSPDGRTVAFESDRGGEKRIWIQDLRSGAESAVTSPGASYPRFSPDGASILFAHQAGDREPELVRVSLIGGEERRVAAALEGDWSPDGDSVATIHPPSGIGSDFELGVVPAAGGPERTLYSSAAQLTAPRFSPDGTTIAVSELGLSSGVPDRIVLVDVTSGAARRVDPRRPGRQTVRILGVAWRDPGTLLLLVGDLEAAVFRASAGRLALLHLADGRLETLAPVPEVWRGIDVAADGRILFATGNLAQNLALAPLEPALGDEPQWATEGSYTDRQPAWSPDGRQILFSSDRSGNLDLWTVQTEGGALARITDDPADDWDPAWSPDGTKLLFSSNRSGKYQIWIAEPDGSSPRQVTHDDNAQNPTMTADGKWIVYNSFDPDPARRGLWKIRSDGRDATHFADTGPVNVPDLSRDGRYVAYRGETSQSETRLLRFADGGELGFALRGPARFRWLPGAARPTLVLLRAPETARSRSAPGMLGQIGLVEIGPGEVAGAPRWLAPTPVSRSAETFDLAPDGTRAVFSTARDGRSQIYLVEGLLAAERR